MKNTITISATNIERLFELFFQLAEGCLEGYMPSWQWEVEKTPCGAKYIYFPYKGTKTLEIHADKAEMTSEAAGIAMTLKALSHLYLWCELSASDDIDNVFQVFHKLRDYVLSHKEQDAILSFIE